MLKTKSQTQYTIKELLSYVRNPNSSVHRITDQLHVGLTPGGLEHFKESVIACVTRAKVGRFDHKLNGIVLDIRNFKLAGNVYPIHDDDPQLHIDLNADLYVFQPTVGAVIKGVIKHIARGHISVTVHRVFNVAIRLDGDKEGLAVNMEIVIRITDFDLTLKLPFIAGVLAQPPKLAKKKIVFDETAVPADSEDEVDQKPMVAQFLAEQNIKIKKEPLSESSSESSNSSDTDGTKSARDDRRTTKRLKREPSVESSSDSSSDEELPVANIKREQTTSSSSDSSSSSDDEETTITAKPSIKLEAKSIKNESSSSDDSSSSEEDTKSKVKPNTSVKKETPHQKKRKATDGDQQPEHTPKKTKPAMDDSLANLSAFATPGLSSTMKPDSAKKSPTKKSTKPKDKLQELMAKMLARKV